jgi:hypothetical protein
MCVVRYLYLNTTFFFDNMPYLNTSYCHFECMDEKSVLMFVMRLISLGIKVLNHEIVRNIGNLMCRAVETTVLKAKAKFGWTWCNPTH